MGGGEIMLSDGKLRAARVLSVIAATFIALACGTNYAYSAWAPDFAAKLKLSSTQSNLIGTFANLGMYISGIPVGLVVDTKGPRPLVLFGAVGLGVGYFVLHRAYLGGQDSIGMPWLCFFAFLTGVGGCAAFAASIKTSALNWPNHRGTATAFPLAAYGLSAFFFSTISSLAFNGDPAGLLLLFTVSTFTIPFIGFFFLHVVPHSFEYSAVPSDQQERPIPNPMIRTKSEESKINSRRLSHEPGTQFVHHENPAHEGVSKNGVNDKAPEVPNTDTDETASLVSRSSSITELFQDGKNVNHHSHHLDLRGLAMLPTIEFWQLFALLGILTGIGLMTINNVGNDATALWKHYDDTVSLEFIQKQQATYVSLLSLMSACGRILSGIGSDVLVRKLNMNRFWCLFVSSLIFCIAQFCGARNENPHLLMFLSASTGLAYGFLFGVFPSIVAATFGINGLSQNWGFMTVSPIISGNIFNLLYGHIYDSHSIILPDGRRDCESLTCYNAAYWVTFSAGVVALVISLWCIRRENVISKKAKKNREIGREV